MKLEYVAKDALKNMKAKNIGKKTKNERPADPGSREKLGSVIDAPLKDFKKEPHVSAARPSNQVAPKPSSPKVVTAQGKGAKQPEFKRTVAQKTLGGFANEVLKKSASNLSNEMSSGHEEASALSGGGREPKSKGPKGMAAPKIKSDETVKQEYGEQLAKHFGKDNKKEMKMNKKKSKALPVEEDEPGEGY